MLKTILLPLDSSSLAERALIYAAALARRSGARIVLVEAVQAHTLPGVDSGSAQRQITDRAEAYLSSLATRLTGRWDRCRVSRLLRPARQRHPGRSRTSPG